MVDKQKNIKQFLSEHADENGRFKVFIKNRAASSELDQHFRDLHNEIFIRDGFDCCKCANCCKLYDIRIEQSNIPAIIEYLGQSERDFIDAFLVQDKEEDGVYIIKDKPCCFLAADGKCRIYDVRPLVCRDFPHTKKPNRLQNLMGIMSFAEDCPVLFQIIERLKQIYGFNEQVF
jgi:Fe-S-cluster containining protein